MANLLKPKFSVIIVTRNREKIIAECIARLLNETEQPDEIIVVDSSTTNATEKILHKFPSVIYHSVGDKPYSMVSNRNIGISMASGDVVAFIDDDCFVQPGWFHELSRVFMDQDIVAAGGRIIYHPWKICSNSNIITEINLDKDVIWAEWDRVPDGMIDIPTLPGGNCAVRRKVALRVGGFDTNFIGSANLEETDFFLRVAKIGGRIVFLPTAVVEHHAAPRTDNITRSDNNYIYRYSLVRNRLYFLRKHQATGFYLGLVHQFLHLLAGCWKRFVDFGSFSIASLCGLIVGLFAHPKSKNEGLLKEIS